VAGAHDTCLAVSAIVGKWHSVVMPRTSETFAMRRQLSNSSRSDIFDGVGTMKSARKSEKDNS